MKNMIFNYALAACLLFTVGCVTNLEKGGPYNIEGREPDRVFYAVDAAFDVAYSVVDGAFKFERENRVKLFKLEPKIKHALDEIRPEAASLVIQYTRARTFYLLTPTPAGLTELQSILAQVQKISAAALQAIPKE